MIRPLILYFLSIKETHGYEIQKYIQLNHMESWTKIQSGSIYYALTKLEQEGFIQLSRIEKIGKKNRKVYKITEKGLVEKTLLFQNELKRQMNDVGSDKFVLYPFVGCMDKDVLVLEIKDHLKTLINKQNEIKKWKALKVAESTTTLEALSFDLMIDNLDGQIKWHEVLLADVDTYIQLEPKVRDLIGNVDFSMLKEENMPSAISQERTIEQMKKDILSNPETAQEDLENLIKLLKTTHE